jgi:hypothetical protein
MIAERSIFACKVSLRQAGWKRDAVELASARKSRDGFEASRQVLIDKVPAAKQFRATQT